MLSDKYLSELYADVIKKNPGEPEYIFTEVGVGCRMVEPD